MRQQDDLVELVNRNYNAGYNEGFSDGYFAGAHDEKRGLVSQERVDKKLEKKQQENENG